MLVVIFRKFSIIILIISTTLIFVFEKHRYKPFISLEDIKVDEIQESHLNELSCAWHSDRN